MASKPSTRQLSDKHEREVAGWLGARLARSSGNQFVDPMDGRHDDGRWRFAFDGKATLGKSVGVTREMWWKAVDQAGSCRPLLPLRFYDDYRLTVGLDLVVCGLDDMIEMVKELRGA